MRIEVKELFGVKIDVNPFRGYINAACNYKRALYLRVVWKMKQMRTLKYLFNFWKQDYYFQLRMHSAEIEVQAVNLIYGQSAQEYRLREAMRWNNVLAHMGKDRDYFYQQMNQYSKESREWVIKNRDYLKRYNLEG